MNVRPDDCRVGNASLDTALRRHILSRREARTLDLNMNETCVSAWAIQAYGGRASNRSSANRAGAARGAKTLSPRCAWVGNVSAIAVHERDALQPATASVIDRLGCSLKVGVAPRAIARVQYVSSSTQTCPLAALHNRPTMRSPLNSPATARVLASVNLILDDETPAVPAAMPGAGACPSRAM